jgi:hypothetical protein
MLGEVLNPEEKAVQLTIDALKDAAAWPGPDQRTLVVLASQPMAAEPHREGHPPAELYAGRGPGQRIGNAMNTRSSYPDVEVPEISLPRFVRDRAGERGAAVPLMGPADPGTATPLMLPSR